MDVVQNRIKWISNLRIIATIAVITVHVSMDSRYGKDLYADLIYGSVARFCVPIFVMITGVLIIPKNIDLYSFTKKWWLKILVPFIFWNVPYLIYQAWTRLQAGESLVLKAFLIESFKRLYKGDISFHFWYVYMICGVYFFIPIIGKWARFASKQELLYFLIIWFVLLFMQIPALNKYNPPLELFYFTGYTGYLVLGYYLHKHQPPLKIWFPVLLIGIGYGLTSALTYHFTKKEAQFVHTYYDYLRPNIVVLSAGVFLLVKHLSDLEVPIQFLQALWQQLEKHSYGIYLIHLLVLIFLKNHGIGYFFIHPLIGIPTCTAICLLVSCALVWALNKVPKIGQFISG